MTIYNEDQLTAFALGTLDKRTHQQIERKLETSVELRSALNKIQQTLAALADAERPVTPSPQLRQRLLTSLGSATRFEGFVDRMAALFNLSAAHIRTLLSHIDHAPADPWEKSALPGTLLLRFDGGPAVQSATCGLVHVKPGRIFPAHQHRGDESIIVLQGSAQEDSGRLFKPGDIGHATAGSTHTFRTLGKEPFVFAVLLEADNKWLLGQTLLDHLQPSRRFGHKTPE